MGYVKLTDFGLSLIDKSGSCQNVQMCGTREYFAPEMVSRMGYGCSVDWWALGCLAFELVDGFSPIKPTSNSDKLYQRIQTGIIKYPLAFGKKFKSFVQGLLTKNPQKRMKFVETIKEHPWLGSINWEMLYNKKITPPAVKPSLKYQLEFDEVVEDSVLFGLPALN